MRAYLVDTLAMIVFFTTAATLTELYVAGMAPEQVVTARLVMIPVMMATARPYGVWRAWVFARLAPRGALGRTATDVVAFLGFQVPVYVATLAFAGASMAEIVAAVAGAIVGMILLSRPYGLFLDAMRRWAQVYA